MSNIVPYLIFDGKCEKVLKYYQEVLGGELHISRYEGSPMVEKVSDDFRDKVLHGSLTAGKLTLMAADTSPEQKASVGDNIHLCINFSSAEEQQKVFDGFSSDGSVTMPLNDTFWGSRFGMLKDKFGINWMLNFEKSSNE